MADLSLMLDTNCWLDYYIPNRPRGAQTRELIRYAFVHDIKLLYPAAIAKDVYYLIDLETKRFIRSAQGKLTQNAAALASEAAWSAVNHMRENAFAASIGQADVWYAAKLRSVHEDFEDNLVLAAAERVRATYLVTSDEQLLRHATVAALTPEKALAALKVSME